MEAVPGFQNPVIGVDKNHGAGKFGCVKFTLFIEVARVFQMGVIQPIFYQEFFSSLLLRFSVDQDQRKALVAIGVPDFFE